MPSRRGDAAARLELPSASGAAAARDCCGRGVSAIPSASSPARIVAHEPPRFVSKAAEEQKSEGTDAAAEQPTEQQQQQQQERQQEVGSEPSKSDPELMRFQRELQLVPGPKPYGKPGDYASAFPYNIDKLIER